MPMMEIPKTLQTTSMDHFHHNLPQVGPQRLYFQNQHQQTSEIKQYSSRLRSILSEESDETLTNNFEKILDIIQSDYIDG